jgi:uncharacterized coiled-coil DUF342 family protein
MPRSKTPISERIENAKTEIRQCENQIKKLMNRNSKAERSQRTRRLIQRGALLESKIKEADTLTNEQIKRLLITAFKEADGLREQADALRAENAASAAKQNGETKTEKAE